MPKFKKKIIAGDKRNFQCYEQTHNSLGVRRLFREPNFAHFATLMPNGSPQVTPVWVELEDESILVNTAKGRAKLRNVRKDPLVAISIADRNNPYSSAFIRERVVKVEDK